MLETVLRVAIALAMLGLGSLVALTLWWLGKELADYLRRKR